MMHELRILENRVLNGIFLPKKKDEENCIMKMKWAVLKWILKKWDGKVWIEFICLWVGTIGSNCKHVFLEMWGVSSPSFSTISFLRRILLQLVDWSMCNL